MRQAACVCLRDEEKAARSSSNRVPFPDTFHKLGDLSGDLPMPLTEDDLRSLPIEVAVPASEPPHSGTIEHKDMGTRGQRQGSEPRPCRASNLRLRAYSPPGCSIPQTCRTVSASDLEFHQVRSASPRWTDKYVGSPLRPTMQGSGYRALAAPRDVPFRAEQGHLPPVGGTRPCRGADDRIVMLIFRQGRPRDLSLVHSISSRRQRHGMQKGVGFAPQRVKGKPYGADAPLTRFPPRSPRGRIAWGNPAPI